MYPNQNNPMLKGYVSHQERERERERERRSRCQIKQQASRDFFMEQTSGATFSQPVRVKPDDLTAQISNILGEFDQVAPIMRSEKARNSLVGAFAMPCTPAPVHQDHDHLFAGPPASPMPPPPPSPLPRQERRVEPRPPPAPAARQPFQPPPPPPPPPAGRLQRPGASRPDKRSMPGDLETILQEMRVPGMVPITPLKANSQPFVFPAVRDMPPVTPLHRPSDDIRVPPMEVNLASPEAPRWDQQSAVPPPAPAATLNTLSYDLSVSSDDSDDEPPEKVAPARDPPAAQKARSSHRSRTSSPPPAEPPPPPPPEPVAPPPADGAKAGAASSGSSSESDESESAESESESGEEPAPAAVVSPAVSQRSAAEAKDGAESPSANAGSKWSLISIMNNGKDASGTPMSSVFGNTPARSLSKMSPHDFPNSADAVSPSSADPADDADADADIALEDIISHVPAQVKVSSPASDGAAPMEMSSSSSEEEPEDREPPVSSGSVRSTTGSNRPRPRLSAAGLSESDSEKLSRAKPRATPRPTAAAASPSPSPSPSTRRSSASAGRRRGRVGRPRAQARPSPPPPALSDSDSDAEPPPPPPPRPVPTKASLKSPAAAAEASRRSRPLLSTASESSDDAAAAPAASPPPPPPPPPPRACSSDSDSPPKLDAGGVSTSDANKKATFNRLFHRFRKTSRPTPNSERSVSQSPSAEPRAPPPPPLPQLTQLNGVPSLRCRIDRWLVPDARQRAETREALLRRGSARGDGREETIHGDRLRDSEHAHNAHHTSHAHHASHASHANHTNHTNHAHNPSHPEHHPHSSHNAHNAHNSHSSHSSHHAHHAAHSSHASHARPEASPHGAHARRDASGHHRAEYRDTAHPRAADDVDSGHQRLEGRSESAHRRRHGSEESGHHRGVAKLEGASPREEKGHHHYAGLKRESPSPRERTRHHSGAKHESPRAHKHHRKAGHRSRHHGHEDAATNKLTPRGGDSSVRSHSSCSSRAPDDVTRDDDAASVTSHKRRCHGLTSDGRQKTAHESRIESPPTGVREADSSTNPTTTVTVFDSNVPAALYTNQPFPILPNQHQYLKQARRLKRAADTEGDMTLKLIRYTQAVIYFLLTALCMEKEHDGDDGDAMSSMLHDTLKLIKDMLRLSSATYRKQGKRPTHTDHKLQTLLLRCQGLIYLRLFKLREAELKRVQRQVSDLKTQTLTDRLSEDATCQVPVDLFRLMLWCNEQQTHLQNWLEHWEQADEQLQLAQDTAEFFGEVDRSMGGLVPTSSLLSLVYYIRETTRRLQEMHSRAVV